MPQDLLEPERLYSSELKEKHHNNTVKFFEDLTKRSGVDLGANKQTCQKYYEEAAVLEGLKKKARKLHALKVFFIILCFILGGIMGNLKRVYVEKKPEFAIKAKELLKECKGYLGLSKVSGIRVLIRYDVEGISDETYTKSLKTVFCEQPVDVFFEEEFDIYTFLDAVEDYLETVKKYEDNPAYVEKLRYFKRHEEICKDCDHGLHSFSSASRGCRRKNRRQP